MRRGPELLPVAARGRRRRRRRLRRRSCIFAGVRRGAARRRRRPTLEHHRAPARITHPEHASSTFRYCTNFAVTGAATSTAPASFARCSRRSATRCSSSATHATLRVHVHTDEPERRDRDLRRRRRGLAARRRRHARAGRRPRPAPVSTAAAAAPAARCGALAVVSGRGHARRCSRRSACTCSTAARRSTPRPTSCSPASTASPPRRSSSCPTARTCIMAAERAAELSEKVVVVVPTRSQQAGLVGGGRAACPTARAAENAAAMSDGARARCGPAASRRPRARTPAGASRVGDAVGFVDDELVAWGDAERDARARCSPGSAPAPSW